MVACDSCREDWEFLRLADRPSDASDADGPPALRIVDLFCGCGGLSLGLAEAARRLGRAAEIPLAVDSDPDAISVFEANFPSASTMQARVEDLFAGGLGALLLPGEEELRETVGRVDILVGGPPCQGHSDLNNHTRRRDPRNALYDRMARAVEVLRPAAVLIENVPAVVRDAAGVVGVAEQAVKDAGYEVASRAMNLVELGIPQRRRRHILIAFPAGSLDPQAVLNELVAPCVDHPTRNVRWAIEDLEGVAAATAFERAPARSPENAARINWLFDNDEYDLPNSRRPKCHREKTHTYKAMYGRLRWDEPAQTVTTGFGSMGQGRYVHPSQRRTITPREAARLQSFPDFFDFSAVSSRTAWARMIGNAVPPLLSCNVGLVIFQHMLADALEQAA